MLKLKNIGLVIVFLINFSPLIFSQSDGPTLLSPPNGSIDYDTVKVTFTWSPVDEAISYDLEVCKSDTFYSGDGLKTYKGITGVTYTPSDFFDYNKTYYWRVKAKIGTVYTEYSEVYNLTTGTPLNEIITSDAKILFRHNEGKISEITYLGGSGKQLLDTLSNFKTRGGLARIMGESNTKLANWNEDPAGGINIYNYENALYGSKTVEVKYIDSIIVKVSVNLVANKTAVLSTSWLAGGDNGPLYDNVLYSGPNPSNARKTTLIYPIAANKFFTGYIDFLSVTDDRFDEAIGFLSNDSVNASLTEDISFNSTFTLTSGSSPTEQVLVYSIMKKNDLYPWANKSYIIVTDPKKYERLKGLTAQVINWETYGITGNLNIDLSADKGLTYPYALATNTANDDSQKVDLPAGLSALLPIDSSCIIKITAGGNSFYSEYFSISDDQSTVFKIPNDLTGSPTDKISVPIFIEPVAGDSVSAVDIRLYYNKDLFKYTTFVADDSLKKNNWYLSTPVTDNPLSGYVQIGTFKLEGGKALTSNDTLFTIVFSIKPAARVGLEVPFNINNINLSAVDQNAQKINVLGVDGKVVIYSRINGSLFYMTSKKPVVGSYLMRVVSRDVNNVITGIDSASTSNSGYYDFSNIKPGNFVSIEPAGKLVLPAIEFARAVDAADAKLAFSGRDGGPTQLTEFQKIVADINDDGIISSSDAYGILCLSTGEVNMIDFNDSSWVFVDSSYKLTASNWANAPRNKSYASLDSVKNKQSFWGSVRGDVDGKGYYSPAVAPKSVFPVLDETNSDITFTVPVNVYGLPGDTVLVPLSVLLNGKNIGAFNVSVSFDKDVLSYLTYNKGEIISTESGWVFSSHAFPDQVNLGATDFNDVVLPISQNGSLAVLKFIINEKVNLGDSSKVLISFASASDYKLNSLVVGTRDGKVTVSEASSVNESKIIYKYSLDQNYPNPFNPATVITYSIANEVKVNVEVYNAIGERVASLIDAVQQAGKYTINWNASGLASGIYFYRIKAGEFVQTRKMMLLK